MNHFTRLRLLFVLVVLLCGGPARVAIAQSKVSVAENEGSFQLLRDGKPFTVKGVGGHQYLAELKKAGGNSIRTWSAENLDGILQQAHVHGLSVCVGLWLGHQKMGFNYQDQESVLRQLDDVLADVRRYKDHPAVLLWGVGNEMEGEAGNDPSVWYAVNHAAREIKRIDPNHPTMTVIAELGEEASKIRSIERFCPDIDIIGVNSYGGISTVAERYKSAGGTKPYIVTEYGPLGPWEVAETAWGSPIEPTSTMKGRAFAMGYQRAVTEQAGLCLGSYAFLWGHKQETTATWFGMLLNDGRRLAATDVVTEAWTGSPPPNRCPEIVSIKLEGTEKLKPGETVTAKVVATDPEQDPLKIEWVLRTDSGTIADGALAQVEESTIADAVQADGDEATVTVPAHGGGYRIFAYVYDPHRGAAVANIPFFVDVP